MTAEYVYGHFTYHALSPMTPPEILRVWRIGEHWCIVATNGIGFYLGYVSLPDNHPWFELELDDIPADAHGGLTWAKTRTWEEFDGDGAPEGMYIGFDCAHFCDSPIPGSYMEQHWPASHEAQHPPWTEELVAQEVRRLAVQAQAAAVVGNYMWSDA